MTFEEFAAERLPGLLRFAAILTGDRALAEDLAQEVLIRAHSRWRKIGSLDRVLRPQDDPLGAAGAVTAVAVIAAVAHEPATKATPLAVPALRTRLLAAIDTASGDILYAHSESAPGGRTWQSPAYPQPGQEVHFRVLGLGSDGTVFKDGEYSFRMPSGSDAASSYTSNLDQGGLQLPGRSWRSITAGTSG